MIEETVWASDGLDQTQCQTDTIAPHIHVLYRDIPFIHKRCANLTHAAPAHPCARGIPFILNIIEKNVRFSA